MIDNDDYNDDEADNDVGDCDSADGHVEVLNFLKKDVSDLDHFQVVNAKVPMGRWTMTREAVLKLTFWSCKCLSPNTTKIKAVNGIQTLVLFGRHSDPNELRQRPEEGDE